MLTAGSVGFLKGPFIQRLSSKLGGLLRETNAPFIGRVEMGVETSVYITEFAVIRVSDLNVKCGRKRNFLLYLLDVGTLHPLKLQRDLSGFCVSLAAIRLVTGAVILYTFLERCRFCLPAQVLTCM